MPMEMGRSDRKSGRARRAPSKLDNSGDNDRALAQALRKSLLETKRLEHAVHDAPVFHPSLEEFNDPLAYIATLAEAGRTAGIVKIVTPEEWRPTFSLNMDKPFNTKRQLVHKLQEGLPFDEGRKYNQAQYKAMADEWACSWFAKHPSVVSELVSATDAGSIVELIEREFWRLVEHLDDEEAVVEYASDINTQEYASGFGELTASRRWDLTTVPDLPSSLLSKVGMPIEGLTRPWLYFGMLFATFCWHCEDHCLYSINYHHAGAPKTWYGLPGSAAQRYEELLRASLPERLQEDRDLLFSLTVLLPPGLLTEHGVPVHHCVQRPGEMVVTFPRAYHAGFSHGWNCAEATNVALYDWLPTGRAAADKYARGPGMRPAVFSHNKLLWDWSQAIAQHVHVDLQASLPRAPLASASSVVTSTAAASAPDAVAAAEPVVKVELQVAAVSGGSTPAVRVGVTPAPPAAAAAALPAVAQAEGAGTGNTAPCSSDTSVGRAPQCLLLLERQLSEAGASTSAGQPSSANSRQPSAASGLKAPPTVADTANSHPTGAAMQPAALQQKQPSLPGSWELYRRRVLQLDGGMLPGIQATARVDSEAATAQLRQLGIDGPTLALVHAEVAGMVLAEIGYRTCMRRHGVRMLAGGACTSASDDRVTCCVCEGLPYLSYIRCRCKGGAAMRCWLHADLADCSCKWFNHELVCTHSDCEMLMLVFRLWMLLPQELQQRPLSELATHTKVLYRQKVDKPPKVQRPPKRKLAASLGGLLDKPPKAATLEPGSVAAAASSEPDTSTHMHQDDSHHPTDSMAPAADAAGNSAADVGAVTSPSAGGAEPVKLAAAAGKPPQPPQSRGIKASKGASVGARRPREKSVQCTACGGGVKAGGGLVCIACDCSYHARCMPAEARRRGADAPDIWLCEFCMDAQ